MAGIGGAQHSLRKALGALKDSTTVGLAKVNSDYKELDVAIVKATYHDEIVAKEKHIRTIFDAVSASRPRADVAYCMQSLGRRLAKTRNWAVALKTLNIIHRALRELDATFRDNLIFYSQNKCLVLNLSYLKDDSSPNAWDYSAWVRSYALYIEERVECYRIVKYDVPTDNSKIKELDTPMLIDQLPALQQLLNRLLGCQPEGAARYNRLIPYALAMIAAESVKLYAAIKDGIVILVDKFHNMKRHDAVRALEIYRKAQNQAERLSEFFEVCRGYDFGKDPKYVKVEQLPASFMTAMETYIKDAPQASALPGRVKNDDGAATPKAIDHKPDVDAEKEAKPAGLNDLTQASELDDKNALTPAIYTSEDQSISENGVNFASTSTGWEATFDTAPSSNGAAVAESILTGGLDVYDPTLARRAKSTNPFESIPDEPDPFGASNNILPPLNVQMATMAQQQAFMMQQEAQQPMFGNDPTNPFGNPFLDQSAQSYASQTPYLA